MDAKRFVGAGLVALITALACGGMSTKAGGSNTNWFATCTSTAECTGGLECWCGICTTACATDCTASTAAATCVEPPAACGDPSEKNACAVSCKEDADCRPLGSGATCVGSVCARSKTTTKSDGGTLSCDVLRSTAIAKFNPLLVSADVSCKTTDDCTAAYDLSCGGACGSLAIVSKTGNAALTSEAVSIEQNYCRQFTDQGCTIPPAPCVPPSAPACVSGKCQPFTGQTTGPDGGTCDDQATKIDQRINDTFGTLDASCSSNDDCVRIRPELDCAYGCGSPVSTTAAAAFETTRTELDRELCSPYLAEGCMPLLSGCGAEPAEPPSCIKGICTDVFSTTTSPDAGETCADRTAGFNAQIRPVVDAVDKKCTGDGDCKVVMLANQCVESCTYIPASKSGAASIQDELDAIDANSCSDFAKAGCTVTRLPCVAPPTATCAAGVCKVAP